MAIFFKRLFQNLFILFVIQSFSLLRTNRKGTLVRERFGRLKVDNRVYLKDLICYIHHNPIHHFNVEKYSEWFYSSYNSYTLELENELLQKKAIIQLFGGIPQIKRVE